MGQKINRIFSEFYLKLRFDMPKQGYLNGGIDIFTSLIHHLESE
jgi:hypothetical protein